jgi:DNA primase
LATIHTLPVISRGIISDVTAIDEVKARIDIVELVSETVQLRRSGKNYTGFCPFHPNSRTPAFVVFSDSGTWRCFGQCNEGGDIFKFVMKKEGWDFAEALRYLAERAGIQLKPPSAEEQAAAEEHAGLRALLEDAVTFYRHQLLNTPPGKQALEYLLQKRGLKEDALEAFGIGYAPQSWDVAVNYFVSKGHTSAELLAAGLATEREAGHGGSGQQGIYDRFRHRVMFPIRDANGRMAGFGARILNPEDVPKFLNSPQTPVFDKGRLLYGLDRARKSIRSLDQAVIVEGYLDVIALHQAGFTNVVSPMGTALTEHQLALLKRFSQRIVLALDPDAAGNQATLRGLQIARQAMDREQDPVFDARGLLGHEARLQADIRVTTLPPGEDPDEVVNRDPKEWERVVENAHPIVIHVMEALASGRDLNDPKTKSEIANQVLPLIEDVPSAIERDTYRQRLARLLRVDESALLRASVPKSRPRPSAQRPVSKPARIAVDAQDVHTMSSYMLEAHCLGILLRRPDLLYQVDRQMLLQNLARLTEEDFQHADHQAILHVFKQSIDQDMAEPLNYVLNSLSMPMMELADGLLDRTTRLDPNEERVLEDLMRSLLTLRQRSLYQEIEYLHYLFQEAQEKGDLKALQHRQAMAQLAEVRRRIDQALAVYTDRSMKKRRN